MLSSLSTSTPCTNNVKECVFVVWVIVWSGVVGAALKRFANAFGVGAGVAWRAPDADLAPGATSQRAEAMALAFFEAPSVLAGKPERLADVLVGVAS